MASDDDKSILTLAKIERDHSQWGRWGWHARVEASGGTTFWLSRLDGETRWVVDARYLHGRPWWWGGETKMRWFGDRRSSPLVMAGPRLEALLNEAIP